ncbi:MAG: NAD-dependent malic enzyme [bacterium]
MKVSTNIITVRFEIDYAPGFLANVTSTLHRLGGEISHTAVVDRHGDKIVRDLTIFFRDEAHKQELISAIKACEGIRVISILDQVFQIHLGGKVEIKNKLDITGYTELSLAYTPGVAEVCKYIEAHPGAEYDYTIKGNCVAIITDGTAVLGLGDIGPAAGMPVMEGKANLFKSFAGVNAFPLALATTDVEEIIMIVKALAPAFGGVNLEDIAAPRCFEIEKRLRAELDIPVFHDDQHGTAVVVLAGLLNALKIVGKPITSLKVVVSGAGAAGVSVSRLLMKAGVPEGNFILLDSKGILHTSRADLQDEKREIAESTNSFNRTGDLAAACVGMDLFIGLSKKNVLTPAMLDTMAKDPIVFAMANPDPEILPEAAAGHVRIMATGRSDYPNQINNVLCFPGLFRGALDARVRDITDEMLIAAAEGIAGIIAPGELHEEYIIPSIFNPKVAPAVAEAVIAAAERTGTKGSALAHMAQGNGVAATAVAGQPSYSA